MYVEFMVVLNNTFNSKKKYEKILLDSGFRVRVEFPLNYFCAIFLTTVIWKTPMKIDKNQH